MKIWFLLGHKIKVFLSFGFKLQILIIEALAFTAIVRLAMVTLSFKTFRRFIGKSTDHNVLEKTEKDYLMMLDARWAVSLVSKYTPWESKCLVQAVAVRWMLKRRNVESTLHLGIARDTDKKILAHAWLCCGEIIVIGERKDDNFKEVAKFS